MLSYKIYIYSYHRYVFYYVRKEFCSTWIIEQIFVVDCKFSSTLTFSTRAFMLRRVLLKAYTLLYEYLFSLMVVQ